MGLIHIDPCQVNSLNLWDTAAPTYAAGGPFGDRWLSSTSVPKTFGSNLTSVIYGALVAVGGTGQISIVQFRDGTSVQFSLNAEVSGGVVRYSIRNGLSGTILLQTSNTFSFGTDTWRWIEVKITSIGNTANIEIRVDGPSEGTASGVDVTTTANNFITNVLVNPFSANTVRQSAIWIGDTSGSTHNDFKGPRRGGKSIITADGAITSANWVANTGTRPAAVDDDPSNDGDTTYIACSTAGSQNSFVIPDTASGIVPDCVLLSGIARRDDAGPRTHRLFLRKADGTIVNAATETLGASFVGYNYLYPQDPFTSVAWSKSVYDGMEPGVELVS